MKNIFKAIKNTPIRGFTFVELMVTLAIISVLSVIILPSFRQAQANTRDARRKGDLKRMQTALELYYEDNKDYPTTSGGWYSSEPGDVASNNNGNWIPGLVPKYISQLPRDPRGGISNEYCAQSFPTWKAAYLYLSDGSSYKILSHCAPEGVLKSDDSFVDKRSSYAWSVCNDEAGCSY